MNTPFFADCASANAENHFDFLKDSSAFPVSTVDDAHIEIANDGFAFNPQQPQLSLL